MIFSGLKLTFSGIPILYKFEMMFLSIFKGFSPLEDFLPSNFIPMTGISLLSISQKGKLSNIPPSTK